MATKVTLCGRSSWSSLLKIRTLDGRVVAEVVTMSLDRAICGLLNDHDQVIG
jgi:hypothetical protein